jgi:hypothetical protein
MPPELRNWLLCDCLLGLLPALLVWFGSWLVGPPVPLVTIIRDGQLYFYCSSLCAVALRDLIKSPVRSTDLTLWVPGLLLAVIFFSYIFALAVQHSRSQERGGLGPRPFDMRVGWTSVIFVIASTALAACRT